jgi:hypothetical protein
MRGSKLIDMRAGRIGQQTPDGIRFPSYIPVQRGKQANLACAGATPKDLARSHRLPNVVHCRLDSMTEESRRTARSEYRRFEPEEHLC